jgi:glycosyltransferase involved in cell wall biosynthesis
MKKIALISHSAHLHGAERMLLNLALLLKQHSDLHPILILPGQGDFSEIARSNGLQFVFANTSPWYIYGSTATYFQDTQASADLLITILSNMQADIVIINTLTNISPLLAAVQLNLPSIVWVHGVIDASMVGSRDSQFVYWNENLLLHTASAVVANSKWTAAFYESVLNIPGIKIIPNWTDIEPLFAASEEKYQSRTIVCLNTFEKNKGHAVLIKAVGSLKQRNINFRLNLYGNGPEQMNIMTMCKKYNLVSDVHFRGVIKDTRQAYDEAAMVINPSCVESFGMTLIEAMARKTPVIATRSGGPQDIIVDGESGYLIDRGNSDSLAKHIELILGNPSKSREMGEKAYLRVQEKFSIRSASSEFANLINFIIRNHIKYPAINMNDFRLLEWLSTRNFFAVGKTSRRSFLVGNTMNALSSTRLVRKLEYNLHSQSPHWAGFEFMIGTNNQIAAGRIKIEVLDKIDSAIVRSKFLEMKDVRDNQVILVEFDGISDSAEKSYIIRFTYQASGRKSLISIYESNEQESRVKRVMRRLGILTRGNTLACRLLYVEK